VQRMLAAMVHRGPDDSGLGSWGDATLGMRRLAVVDCSPLGHQPMTTETERVWGVFNGEAYNHDAFRTHLIDRGHQFRSRSDTEVVLHGYEEYGAGVLERLRGMFGLAVWDRESSALLLARDRLGIKPIYYSVIPGGVAFASELQALLAGVSMPRAVDPVSLDDYLSFGYVPPPRTLIAGVRVLLPGDLLEWRRDTVTTRTWWTMPAPGSTNVRIEDAPARLREIFDESIRLHRVADVPVGAFLSGGIDSTAVVGLMAQGQDDPVRTFSVGFADGPAHLDELGAAAEAARRFGTVHREVMVTGAEVAAQVPDMVAHVDQPSFDGLNTYLVSRAARAGGLTVALSGLGGDELFGGYDTYQVIPKYAGFARAWGVLPHAVRTGLMRMASLALRSPRHVDRRRKLWRLADVTDAAGLYAAARLQFWPSEREAFHAAGGRRSDPFATFEAIARSQDRLWTTVTALEVTTFMQWRLLRDTDVMSMAHSLEVRVPLIDHEVVEFVAGLPPGWESCFGHPKRLLTTSVADVLPPGWLNRPKQGFALPLEHWMRHDLRPVVRDALSPESTRARGWWRESAVADVLAEFDAGRRPYTSVWSLVILELWARRVLDDARVIH